MTRPVYLDYNATAPLKPAVIDAMATALTECGNASSVHRFGRLARRAVEAAREDVASLVNALPRQVVFTSGGTEANNLAIVAAGGRRLIVSAIEHDSVLKAAPTAEILPVDGRGEVDLTALQVMLESDKRPALVAVMLANNETGATQPAALVSHLAHSHGALVHCDAVQAAGKMAIDFARLGADTMALSAHKLGGPQGVGALVVADTVNVKPLLVGGGQERGWRAGTENVAGIRGFGVAARLATEDFSTIQAFAGLRDEMEVRLERAGAVVFAPGAGRLPNTSCIAMPGVSAETQVMALDLAGVAVSAGSACSSGKIRPSHVLRAMGVAPELAASAIRISLGWRTEREDIEHLVEAWTALSARTGVSHRDAAGRPLPAA